MKFRVIVLSLLTLFVVWASGQDQPPREDQGVRLYFLAPEEASHGPALRSQPYAGPHARPGPKALLSALLSGPAQDTLGNPFPDGLMLESWEWDPVNPGNLKVRLSERYSDLTDISLTLADYCIVLTLAQVPGVETVEISSGGYTASYRSHQILKPGEAVLTDYMAKVRPEHHTLP